MTFLFYSATLSLLLAASYIGQLFPARELPNPKARQFVSCVMLPGAVGLLVWAIYGLLQLRWWQLILGFVAAGFVTSVLLRFLSRSLLIVGWGIVFSLAGLALMLWEFAR